MKTPLIIISGLLASIYCHAAKLSSDEIGNFFLPDQVIRFEFDLEDSPKPQGDRITFNLLDYSNRIIATQSVKWANLSTCSIDFPALEREGFFYLEAKAQLKQLAICTLGVLEAASKSQAQAQSRFGTVAHLKHMSDNDRDIMLNLIKRANIGWIREGFLWHEMEAKEGIWTTDRYDDLIDRAQNNGINVLPVLCFGTEWAARSTEGIPPGKRHLAQPNTAAWKGYIANMIKRYGDQIHAWEIWNVPNLPSFWQPSPNADDYADLAADAAAMIRELAPGDTIITAGFSPCQSYLPDAPDQDEQTFVHKLAHKSPLPFDAIGGHPYTVFHTNANAELKYAVSPPEDSTYKLKVPAEYAETVIKILADKNFAYTGFSHYYVKSGDTLSEIAQAFGTTVGNIMNQNPGLSPRALSIGRRLVIPSMNHTAGKTVKKLNVNQNYKVKKGDTLWDIAKSFGTTADNIARLNGLSLNGIIKSGMILAIPGGS